MQGSIRVRQTGMVLLISLVFLLVLSQVGLSSIQAAVSQQKSRAACGIAINRFKLPKAA